MTDGSTGDGPSLTDLLEVGIQPGMDLGGANPEAEAAYRRGYRHAVADLMDALNYGTVTPNDLEKWLEGAGRDWRNKAPLDRKIVPPQL